MNIKNIEEAQKVCDHIVDAVGTVFVGNRILIEKTLAAALANGHVLFEDYPGLGKTLLCKAFARVVGCDFKRIQFTPDLLPAGIIGTKVWKHKTSGFELMKGPVFTHILLADEINRSPPKTQSALLECMEEGQVTIEGETHSLKKPFFVLATQNPIEQEGTYPLPEAQIDRFLMKLSTGYTDSVESEAEILSRRITWEKDDPTEDIKPLMSVKDFIALQNMVEKSIYVDNCILEYISKIVRSTRTHNMVEVGSSPRGGLALLKLSRAMALMSGRDFVTPDDIKMFTTDVLAHRIILDIEYALENVDKKEVIDNIVAQIEPPKDFRPR